MEKEPAARTKESRLELIKNRYNELVKKPRANLANNEEEENYDDVHIKRQGNRKKRTIIGDKEGVSGFMLERDFAYDLTTAFDGNRYVKGYRF